VPGGTAGLGLDEFTAPGGPAAALVTPAAAARLARRASVTLYRWAGPLFAALVPDHRRTVGETAVRHAMDLALDRAILMSTIAAQNGIAGQLWRSPEEQAGPYTLAGGPFIPGSEEAANQRLDMKPDAGAARAVLAASGWADTDADGVLERGTARLELALGFPAGRGDLAAAAAEIAAQLGAIGIRVVPEELGLADYLSAWGPPFDFDLLLVEWVNSPAPDIYDLFHSNRIPRAGLGGELRGGANIAGVSDAILDRVLSEIRATPADPAGADARRSLYLSLAERVRDSAPWVFLWRETGFYAAPKRLEGPAPGPFGLYWNVQDWTWR
jgi:ABC-type transport system substrate-binding protein